MVLPFNLLYPWGGEATMNGPHLFWVGMAVVIHDFLLLLVVRFWLRQHAMTQEQQLQDAIKAQGQTLADVNQIILSEVDSIKTSLQSLQEKSDAGEDLTQEIADIEANTKRIRDLAAPLAVFAPPGIPADESASAAELGPQANDMDSDGFVEGSQDPPSSIPESSPVPDLDAAPETQPLMSVISRMAPSYGEGISGSDEPKSEEETPPISSSASG